MKSSPWHQLCSVCAWIAFGSLMGPPAGAASGAPPMNVLFIVSDDMNNELGTYGCTAAHTPNLDKLAATGIRFDRAYCQFPLCSPSRSSFLSGRWPATTGVLDLKIRADVVLAPFKLLAAFFKENGYVTARVGKIMHNGMEIASEWDRAAECLSNDPTENEFQRRAASQRLREAHGEKLNPEKENYLMWGRSMGREEDFGDWRKAQLASTWLEELSRDSRPFFLAVGFMKPHHPYVAPSKYFDLCPPDGIVFPTEPAGHLDGVPKPAIHPEPGSAGMTVEHRREIVSAYFACIAFVDAQVGRLLATLDRLHLAENTVVVFISDHGYQLGEHQTPEGSLWHKMSLWNEAARVPMILRVPGRKGNGSACGRTVELMDIYPTLAALAGLTPPEHLDGHSLVPLLDNPSASWRYPAFTFLNDGPARVGAAVTTERFRFIEWTGTEPGIQLYDTQADPHEYHNLAADPAFGMRVADMRKLLHSVPAPTVR